MNFSNILAAVNNFVWGPVMLVLLVGTGIFLTIRLKFLPWRNLGFALKSIFGGGDPEKQNEKGDITPFQSLMTALAATIGTGNIVGVATAMVLGGPGAIVWMCRKCSCSKVQRSEPGWRDGRWSDVCHEERL